MLWSFRILLLPLAHIYTTFVVVSVRSTFFAPKKLRSNQQQ